MYQVPIAIVGGGPVGMVLALSLASFDVRSVLINVDPTTRWFPKGSTHNCRTMEHYRRLGLARNMRKLGLPHDHPTDVGFFTNLNGWELARFSMPSEQEKIEALAHAAPTDQIPEPIFRCNQMYVEAHLLSCVRQNGRIDVRFGWRCVEIADSSDRVEIVIEDEKAGHRERISCDYLAGCDGAQSTVRHHLGISYKGEVPPEQVYGSGATMASHLRAPDLYRVLKHKTCWQYRTVHPNVRNNLVTLDGQGEFTVNTKLHPSGKHDPQAVTAMIHECIGENIDIQFLAHSPWTAGHALVADRFGAGRIVLAGDAVHVFTPAGGFGMNTGVDDAANLAWKLAALVSGWGGPKLLETYEIERRPIAFRNTAMAKEFARSMGTHVIGPEVLEANSTGDLARAAIGRDLQVLREEFAAIGIQLGARYDGSPIIASDGTHPPSDDPLIYRPSACPGGRAPHLFFPDKSSLFDQLGNGFCLLHFRGDHQVDVMTDAAAARRVPFKSVKVSITEARDMYESDLVLLRPDHHVAWRGSRLPRDCDALLAQVTGW